MKIKRYDILGEKFDFQPYDKGEVVFYDDVLNLFLARIKELKDKNSQCTILNEQSLEDFNLRSAVINELENLIK